METTRDQTRAFLYAVGVHVFAALVMFAGLLASPPKKVQISGGALEAVLVDMNLGRPLPKPATKPTPKPTQPPQPKAEPPKPVEQAKPEPAPPPPPPQAVPDDITDQRPLPPPLPDQATLNLERQQQEEIARQQEIERQRAQQLEDIRRQRAEAARETQAQEQRLAQAREAQRAEQILNQPATDEPEGSPRPGADVANSLESQYASLLVETIRQRWRRPAGTPVGIRCVMRVRQIIGGEVISAEIGQPCNAPDLVRQSIIDAIERASPLPYQGFETVFNRSLELNFEYDGQ